jgi:hypothetical protein
MNSMMTTDVPVESGSATQPIPLPLYAEDDKVMILETGEVLTVQEDRSHELEPGIVVKETIGRMLTHGEVRPAGHTRQRRDLARSIIQPDSPPPPPPEDCVRLDTPGSFSDELHPD